MVERRYFDHRGVNPLRNFFFGGENDPCGAVILHPSYRGSRDQRNQIRLVLVLVIVPVVATSLHREKENENEERERFKSEDCFD
jgi:hypothetical protein